MAYNYAYINQTTEEQAARRYDLYTYYSMMYTNTFPLSQELDLAHLFGYVVIYETLCDGN